MTQPIIVDQTKYQEMREATDFMKKFKDFDFSTLPEEKLLETMKVFERHCNTIITALKGLVSDIDGEVKGKEEGSADASITGNPAESKPRVGSSPTFTKKPD